MFSTLFSYYRYDISKQLKQSFIEDFKQTDRFILLSLAAYAFILSFITPWQYGYFKLGIIASLATLSIAFVAYATVAGSLICRVIMAAALTVMMAISVQQSNGLVRGILFSLSTSILFKFCFVTFLEPM